MGMFGGMDPAKMAEMQKVSGLINAEIRIDHAEHSINLKLMATTPESLTFVKKFVPNFAEGIAAQLSSFFQIRGEITDVNKPPA